MGFWDRFKKQSKNEVIVEPKSQISQKRNEDEIEFSCTDEGRLVVELIERRTKSGQFYNTTKLVLDNKVVDLEGTYLQNCMVSWYGQDDCIQPDARGYDMGRRNQFKNVLAEIDTDLLWSDEEYCISILKMLLNKNRVDEYLKRGVQENPELPCGKYVGGIEQRDGKYKKFFDPKLGQASHYSSEMVAKRQRIQEQIRRNQERAIADKKAQIARLQQEVDGMER